MSESVTVAAFTKISEEDEAVRKLINGGVPAKGIMGDIPSRGWGIVRGISEMLVGAFVFANPLIVAGIDYSLFQSCLYPL